MGGGPSEWDDYEWVSLPDLPDLTDADLWLAQHPVWLPDGGERVLLVDLDNLRADRARLRERLALIIAVAATADRVHLAGQAGTVRTSTPWLGRLARATVTVAAGPDVADRALLDAALGQRSRSRRAQFAVASNDGIFSVLAGHGTLVLLSPHLPDASRRLRTAACRQFDLDTFRPELGLAA